MLRVYTTADTEPCFCDMLRKLVPFTNATAILEVCRTGRSRTRLGGIISEDPDLVITREKHIAEGLILVDRYIKVALITAPNKEAESKFWLQIVNIEEFLNSKRQLLEIK